MTSQTKSRCGNKTCSCTTEGLLYCSAYCEEAAEQAIERDYCQCEHGCASTHLTRCRTLPASGRECSHEPELQPFL